MNGTAISVRHVSKVYNVFDTPRARLMHALAPRRAGRREVLALSDVSFEVRRGESVAIIGRNGGGKSTLLEILTGTLVPSAGEVHVNGRVSALLELGSGFNPEYTGRDNVLLNGLLLGLTRAEILGRFDEIAAFAEIGDAIERPVKTYSSGMVMRLAFAVQVLTDPDILIIDEALSVGDFFFQQKCFGHIRGLLARGVTLLFVSHDMGAVRDLCSRGLFLRQGRVDYFGDNLEAIRRYLTDAQATPADATPADATPADATPADAAVGPAASTAAHGAAAGESLWSSPAPEAPARPGDKARILAVTVLDAHERPTTHARIGSELVFRVRFRAFCAEPLHVNLVIRNRYDQVVTGTGSYALRTAPPALEPGADATFELRLRPMLEVGNYSFAVSIAQPDRAGTSGVIVDETPLLGPVQITWDYAREVPPFYGMVGLAASARFLVADPG